MSEELNPEVLKQASDVPENVTEESVTPSAREEAPAQTEESTATEAEAPVAQAETPEEEPIEAAVADAAESTEAVGGTPKAEAAEAVPEEAGTDGTETPEAAETQEVVATEAAVDTDAGQTIAAEGTEVTAETADTQGDAAVKDGVEPTATEVTEAAEAAAPEGGQPILTRIENLAGKTLAELSDLFQDFMNDVDRLSKSKEAEAIKSAFYRKLSKEKAQAGLGEEVDEPSENAEILPDAAPVAEEEPDKVNPFEALERGFKSLYADYKKEKAEANRASEKEREENLTRKQAVIDDLRALVDSQEDVSASFPEFRAIQDRWRSIGQVPVQNFRDINSSYQFLVEKFYDKVKINHELRDLDFKKNLEVKEKFCELAEKLSENENVVEAFAELQKLHEQWKEYGPVAKEFRDSIWDRFKAATAVINKRYQAHFVDMKAKQAENLAAKTALCEKVEAIADKQITGSNEWNSCTKQIEDIQKEWRTIGFASRKENQKIYDRFRAACDKFFEGKRDFYAQYKSVMDENYDKKVALTEKAEALKASTDWKKTAEELIDLQKQWKEIGAVPRKKSDAIWKRFRAACDEFFNARDAKATPGKDDYYGNLKAKKRLIEEIKAYASSGDSEADAQALSDFTARWGSLGFVPFKEKENIQKAFREAVEEKFPGMEVRTSRPSSRGNWQGGGQRGAKPKSAKDKLVQEYHDLEQEVATYENNLGFFSSSKNSEGFIAQIQNKIEDAKARLSALRDKIRQEEAAEAAKESEQKQD